jgi:RNA polymerase sigma factor (sigma-70 family)
MTASVEHVFAQIQRWTSSRPADLSDAALLERFIQGREEAAFAALVARHGAMVLRSCRRVLGDAQEAEDAFQATFLILARKAPTLRRPEALPGFLHSVARRVALKARGKSSTYFSQTQLPETLSDPRSDPLARLTARELLTVLDEEVQRLPAAQRSAVVLCCLEGHPQEEAARMLGCTAGSLKGHLERGRRRLHTRLTRRGIALPTALAIVTVSRGEAASVLLRQSAVRAALGGAASSPIAAALADSILKGMFAGKLAGVTALVLTVALSASAAALVYRTPAAKAPDDNPPAALAAPPRSDAGKPAVRVDAQGDPLPAGAIARLGTVRFRHGGRIAHMLFTTDGKHLVSNGDDGVRVWDPVTGKELRRLTPPAGENWSSASDLSFDGEQLVVIHGSDSAIDFWNVRQEKKIDSFGQGDYSLVRISPDGKLVAVCAKNSGIELWDVARREKLRSWQAHKSQVWHLVFTADSRRLLTSSPDGTLRLWDVATGRQIQEFVIANYSVQNLTSLPLSPDGNMLAVIQENEKPKQAGGAAMPRARISVWDTTTGKQLRQLTCSIKEHTNGNAPRFGALTFTPDGKRLLTSEPDHFLRVWDPRTGKELRKIPFDPRGAHVLALSKDGKTLAAGAGMAIHLLDLPNGKAHEPPEGQEMAIAHPYCAVLTPDGRTAVTGSWENAPLVWDVAAGRVRRRLETHNAFLNFLQLSRDGKTLFSHDADNVLRLWDLSREQERSHVQLNFATGMSRHRIESPDKRSLFLADAQGIIHQLDSATGKERSRFQGPKMLWGIACTPDGGSLVGWSGDRKIRVWDAANGRLQHEYSVPKNIKGKRAINMDNGEHGSVYSAALSPDGGLLAMGSLLGHHVPKQKQQYALIFKDLRTGRDIAPCDPLPSAPERLIFSPDGRMLAWSGSFFDPTIHLLEVASGRERRRLAGHRGQVLALAFSADGRRLLSGSQDTTALIWDLAGRSSATLPVGEVQALWADLANEDAARAYRAIHQLAAAPDVAVPFLRKRLRPVQAVDDKRVSGLIANLDSDDFATRQKATTELAKLADQPIAAYRKALESKPSIETRKRLEELLEKAGPAWWDVSGERLRSLRAVETLELAGTKEARETLAIVADGASGARLTEQARAALGRLTTGRR